MILTSPKAWKTKHFYLKLSDCFEIQQAPEQYCSWGAYQMFKQYHDLNYPSHCFKASQDLTKKYLRHVSVMLFLSQFKCIGNFVCCNSIPGHHIATNFCTCHDSIAVMSCAKFCSDRFFRILKRAKQNFQWIWIDGKIISEMGPRYWNTPQYDTRGFQSLLHWSFDYIVLTEYSKGAVYIPSDDDRSADENIFLKPYCMIYLWEQFLCIYHQLYVFSVNICVQMHSYGLRDTRDALHKWSMSLLIEISQKLSLL